MVAPTDGGEPAYLRATRDGYDAIAVGYAARFRAALDARPLDRALLGAFAELVPGPSTPACGSTRGR